MGAIDYWCNSFLPSRRALWDAAIEAQGIPLRVRRDERDSFAEASDFVARMGELGIDSVMLPTADTDPPTAPGPTDYEPFATSAAELTKLTTAHPGRFHGLFVIDPTRGMAGVRRAAEALARDDIHGLLLHTHSWDRGFGHPDLYPFYALAADHAVPVVMQAGTSGGLMASECGKPIGIDRPALYFGSSVRFVLSHTGWPWVSEAIAMALKHANVYVGTAAYPPRHWSDELVRFIRGAGRGKVLFGTSFPTVGHRHALGQLHELELPEVAEAALLGGAARAVFGKLDGANAA